MKTKSLRLVCMLILFLALFGCGLYCVASANHRNQVAIKTARNQSHSAINTILNNVKESENNAEINKNGTELILSNDEGQQIVHYYYKDDRLYQNEKTVLKNVKDVYFRSNNEAIEIILTINTGRGLPDTISYAMARL